MAYHDTEWGVPVHEDRLLFEFLVREGAQAGLSWITTLVDVLPGGARPPGAAKRRRPETSGREGS